MTRTDDEEKVGRKAVHERRNDADPGIHPDDQEHQPHGNHGEEDEGCRGVYNFNDLSCRVFDQLCRVGHVDQVGGHAAEHPPRPLGIFARLGTVVPDLLGHAFVLLHVVLRQHFAAKLGGEIEGADDEEKQQGRARRQHFRENLFEAGHLECFCRLPKVRKNIEFPPRLSEKSLPLHGLIQARDGCIPAGKTIGLYSAKLFST